MHFIFYNHILLVPFSVIVSLVALLCLLIHDLSTDYTSSLGVLLVVFLCFSCLLSVLCVSQSLFFAMSLISLMATYRRQESLTGIYLLIDLSFLSRCFFFLRIIKFMITLLSPWQELSRLGDKGTTYSVCDYKHSRFVCMLVPVCLCVR